MTITSSLPIAAFEGDLINAIKRNQILILIGETGSGKTTQLPQYLYRAGLTNKNMKIGCTQPRRVAAMSVANRVAEETKSRVGDLVGYSVRFEECTSMRTRIKYMTDGMLLREFMDDPILSTYSVIIVDEAHERTINTDVLLGLLKDIVKGRPDLRVIISSATLDAEGFSDYFEGAPVFRIPGRHFPVDVYYTKEPESDYLLAAVKTVTQIHEKHEKGDILVFLTGQEEIEKVVELLTYYIRQMGSKIKELIVYPIYSALPSEQQAKIFTPPPPGARKVVVATNIAETSITIDGIVYVVDTGFSKLKSYNPRNGMEALVITPISKASANQRAGRAGRVGPGKCFRLYTAWAYENELEDANIPEIQRSNVSHVILLLKTLGINDPFSFDFMNSPPAETMLRSIKSLIEIGALDELNCITKVGRYMSEIPVEPMLARSIIAGYEFGCSSEITTIASILSSQGTLFVRPPDKKKQADEIHKRFYCQEGDHITLLKIFEQWSASGFSDQWCYNNFIQSKTIKRAREIRNQLENTLKRLAIQKQSEVLDPNLAIIRALSTGYKDNMATLSADGDGYNLQKKGSEKVYIHPSSVVFKNPSRNVLYHELMLTSKPYIRTISSVDDILVHKYKTSGGSKKKIKL